MPSFEIYAELSRSMTEKNRPYRLNLPAGVRVQNARNPRVLFLECEDVDSAKELTDILDAKGISWQDNSTITIEEWDKSHGS